MTETDMNALADELDRLKHLEQTGGPGQSYYDYAEAFIENHDTITAALRTAARPVGQPSELDGAVLHAMDMAFPSYKRGGFTGGDMEQYTVLCKALGIDPLIHTWNNAHRAALRSTPAVGQPLAEPVTWKTVLVEPTPDMRIAGGIAWAETRDAETYVDNADACYKAMLAASPSPATTVGMEACAKIAGDYAFQARNKVRGARGPKDRSLALAQEAAALDIRKAILSLIESGAKADGEAK